MGQAPRGERSGRQRGRSRPDPVPFLRRPIDPGLRAPTRASFEGPHPVLIDLERDGDARAESQARPVFAALDDYLGEELGIALIAPNVRGSTGFGRTFARLDDGRRREDAVRDVVALLDWIDTQPDLDPRRVAIRGSAYGGYLALASMALAGPRIRAGIDIAGISHFETLLQDSPLPDRDGRRAEFGDERDPETIEFFRSISPLARAAKIRSPLLVIHGINDPRVPVGESTRISAAVRDNDIPVWSIFFDGEGHVIQKREHRIYAEDAQVLFLKEFLIGEE